MSPAGAWVASSRLSYLGRSQPRAGMSQHVPVFTVVYFNAWYFTVCISVWPYKYNPRLACLRCQTPHISGFVLRKMHEVLAEAHNMHAVSSLLIR